MTIKRNTLIAASGLLALTLTVSCGKGDPKSSAAAQQQQKPQPFQYITVEEGLQQSIKSFPHDYKGSKILRYVLKLMDLLKIYTLMKELM